jgi:hypothetical protein
MPKHLPKPSHLITLGLSIPSILAADVAHAQSKSNTKVQNQALPNPDEINKQIKKNYPPELLEDGQPATLTQSSTEQNKRLEDGQPATPTQSPAVTMTAVSSDGNTMAVGTSNYTFVLPTPAIIAIVVIVGGLALFPVVHLLLNSKKILEIRNNSFLSKFTDRFQKPKVLESDAFLHQRNFEKLAQIANQTENLNTDKFSNTEFKTFFMIKSRIAQSQDEYANLDQIIELFNVAISAQASFSTIDSIESKNCSSNQQEFYAFVLTLFAQGVEIDEFNRQIDLKLQDVLTRLKTDEGKVAVEVYRKEAIEIIKHPLAVKLLLLFKKYQLDDYSILRSVSNTIKLLESEDLLNLDALLLLVMVKYEVFEKLGPIVGVADEHNRPETYSKMLQYIGLKARHEDAYQKFQELLLLLKPWATYHQTVVNVRQKYNAESYRLPKDFTAEIPGEDLYNKYKNRFNLITSEKSQTKSISTPNVEIPVLTGVR